MPPTKLERITDSSGNFIGYMHWCPGCRMYHSIDVPRWAFNGDLEKPTFSPSVLVRYDYGPAHEQRRCHYFIVDGEIRYCGDCTHALSGKTIELPAGETVA